MGVAQALVLGVVPRGLLAPLRHGRVELRLQRRLDAGALDLPVRAQFCPARQSPKTKKKRCRICGYKFTVNFTVDLLSSVYACMTRVQVRTSINGQF